MLVAVVTAVAKAVTPAVVPIVLPTVLMHQNTAIAMAAMALASKLRGAEMRFPFRSSFQFWPKGRTVASRDSLSLLSRKNPAEKRGRVAEW